MQRCDRICRTAADADGGQGRREQAACVAAGHDGGV